MARPAPTILQSHLDKRWRKTDVIETDALYQVIFRDRAFGLRHSLQHADYHKYLQTTFVCCTAAEKLAKKLNAMFRTSDFTVREIN